MFGNITDVPGIKVGQVTNESALTGCTVILCEDGAVGGVDVRGAAPGTRETDLLRPGTLVDRVHGVLLAGGSAYGLDAASGVMKYLEEQGIGFDVGVARVPIVPAAILFDLAIGDPKVRPDLNMGYEAARLAISGPVEEGNVGAGTGATVGKFFGPGYAMKSGLGTASKRLDSGVTIGAIVAVNAFGDVYDSETNQMIAGALNPMTGKLVKTIDVMASSFEIGNNFAGVNTTIAVVATDAKLSKEEANKVAQMAQNGLARTIKPVHTMFDGDTVFALSTGTKEGSVNIIGTMAAEVLAIAVKRAVVKAQGVAGLKSYQDIQ